MYFQKEIETMPRAELEALQLERLKTSVERASKVPVYEKKFKEAGISAADITPCIPPGLWCRQECCSRIRRSSFQNFWAVKPDLNSG